LLPLFPVCCHYFQFAATISSLLPLFPACCHYFQLAATKKNQELFCLPRLPVLFCGNNRISLLPSSYRPDFEDRLVIFCIPSSYKHVFEDRHSVFADGGTPQLKMAHQTPSVAQLCGFLAHQSPFLAHPWGLWRTSLHFWRSYAGFWRTSLHLWRSQTPFD